MRREKTVVLKHIRLRPVKRFDPYCRVHVNGGMPNEHREYHFPVEARELIEEAKKQGAVEI